MKSGEDIYIELLANRCKDGSGDAFTELVGLLEQRIFFYVRRLVRSEEDAWDVLQQTWVDVLGSIGRLRDTSRILPWLYRIARNRAVSHIRKESRAVMVPLDDLTADIAEVPDSDFDQQDAADIRAALEMLSVTHREVLTLHFLEDFGIDEIAEVTGTPPGTVKSRLHYGKQALRKALKRQGVGIR